MTSQEPSKKKTFRYFELYIPKILKTIDTDYSISNTAKQQLNSILCLLAKSLSNQARMLTAMAEKKTISDKEVCNAVRISFPDGLMKESIQEAEISLEKYNQRPKQGSRQDKSGLILPPSVTEKILRQTNLFLTKTTPIFLTAILEYVLRQILTNVVKPNGRNRITVRDIELTVRQNEDLNKLFQTFHISLLGGGVVPYIHNLLLTKKPRRRKSREILDNKKYRFRPGTVAIREIRKLQKISEMLFLAKLPFERLVRSMLTDRKVCKDVFIILQYYIEQFLVDFLRDVNTLCVYCNRTKIIPSDIETVANLRKYDVLDTSPYIDLNKPVQEENELDANRTGI